MSYTITDRPATARYSTLLGGVVAHVGDSVVHLDPSQALALADQLQAAVDAFEGHWTPEPDEDVADGPSEADALRTALGRLEDARGLLQEATDDLRLAGLPVARECEGVLDHIGDVVGIIQARIDGGAQ